MPTAQQTAHLAAFQRALRHAGIACTFGLDPFDAIISPLPVGDPRMLDEPEARSLCTAATASLPAVPPARGDILQISGHAHRILHADTEEISGLTTFVLAR